jgi:hypothetical protein
MFGEYVQKGWKALNPHIFTRGLGRHFPGYIYMCVYIYIQYVYILYIYIYNYLELGEQKPRAFCIFSLEPMAAIRASISICKAKAPEPVKEALALTSICVVRVQMSISMRTNIHTYNKNM